MRHVALVEICDGLGSVVGGFDAPMCAVDVGQGALGVGTFGLLMGALLKVGSGGKAPALKIGGLSAAAGAAMGWISGYGQGHCAPTS